MRETIREEEKRENWSPKVYSLEKKVVFTVYTNGLYSHQDKQNYKKQQKHLTVTRTKWEETKKNATKRSRHQTPEEVNSGCRGNSATGTKFRRCSNFLVFSALLSFWSLIYNAEFDSNSSCLDRLNNFGKNSLQKLQN